MEKRTQILSGKQVLQKVERIAHQIHENHHDAGSLVILGIEGGGNTLAGMLRKHLSNISDLKLESGVLQMDKHNPLTTGVTLSPESIDLTNKTVIVVDDVLNSGRTLIHGVKAVIESDVKLVRTVTLVDRRHRKFPIKADYVGLTLATTLLEHISVILEGDDFGTYLD